MPQTDLDDESSMNALHKQLSSYGIDEDQIEKALQEMKNKSDDIRDDDDEEEGLDEDGFLPETNGKSLHPPPANWINWNWTGTEFTRWTSPSRSMKPHMEKTTPGMSSKNWNGRAGCKTIRLHSIAWIFLMTWRLR